MPTATKVRVVPLTVHTLGVLDRNDTGRPDVALADSAAGWVPKVSGPGPVKAMVCAAAATTNDCCTAAAAATVALPAWLAVTVQVPAATRVNALPLTVQTKGVVEAKDTARPDEAVADKGKAAPPKR